MRRLLHFYFVGLFSLLILSCEDQITTSCDTEDLNNSLLQPTLTNVQNVVFNVNCVSCHSGSSPQGGLDLSNANAYSNLINAASSSSSLSRVVPGDSENSYLMRRITGQDGETIMPPAGKMDQQLIELVRRWIDEGAKDN